MQVGKHKIEIEWKWEDTKEMYRGVMIPLWEASLGYDWLLCEEIGAKYLDKDSLKRWDEAIEKTRGGYCGRGLTKY